jgi:hypothetical protein
MLDEFLRQRTGYMMSKLLRRHFSAIPRLQVGTLMSQAYGSCCAIYYGLLITIQRYQ